MSVTAFKAKPAGEGEESTPLTDPGTDSIFFCGNCEWSVFYLLDGGGIQCTRCGQIDEKIAHFDTSTP